MTDLLEYAVDGTQTVKFEVECELAVLPRVETIYWRKTSEEYPVPNCEVSRELQLVGVMAQTVDGLVLVCAFDLADQKFYFKNQAYSVKYWAYLPQGPAA